MKTVTWSAVAAAASLLTGAVQASPFVGRLSDGTPSSTCTVSGADKCAMFYSGTLDITILNDWNIGLGTWDTSLGIGSAQALAEVAGIAQTDFSGWRLPTGNGDMPAGSLNEYLSIWNDAGASLAGLRSQFDGVQEAYIWASTEYDPWREYAWYFSPLDGLQNTSGKTNTLYALAVRSGDVASGMPEPSSVALLLAGLAMLGCTTYRRQ